MAAQNAIANQFQPLFQELETDRSLSDCIREKSKELDQTYRSLSSLLNSIHSTKGSEFDSLIQSSLPLISRCRSQIRDLAELVPQGGYYRWCDDFSFSLRSVASSLVLIHLLATGSLLTKHEAAIILGLSEAHVDSSKLMLSTEDYLHATINAINELARLAVNSVTLADFRTPLRLASFVKEVHAAFQLLNLKNDSLRKRFDGLKYDVKKIEEVVYDISLRGLIPPGQDMGGQGLAFAVSHTERAALVDRLASDPAIPAAGDAMQA
ncbi:related to Translin [Ustilago sp. UG-2017b]|nr:related to Translin [Ustilago sp. UG-2017b]